MKYLASHTKHVILLFLSYLVCSVTLAQAQENQPNVTTKAFASLERSQNGTVSEDELSIYLVPLTAENLSLVADARQSHLQSRMEALAQINIALNSASDGQAEELRARHVVKLEAMSATATNYEMVLGAWEQKGGSDADLQQHRLFASALAAGTLRATDTKTLLRIALNWLTAPDGGVWVLLMLLAILTSIWAMMFLAKLVRNMVRRGLEKVSTLSLLLKSFIVTTVYWLVFALGILIVLGLFGVNVTPLFAVFGGLSFILGFALQDTLGNLASGLMIMVLKPFDTGDYIHTAGVSGTLDAMSVVSTRIRTFDNQVIVVPNSKIWGDVITNVSTSAERRVDLVFGIGYSDNTAQAIEVLSSLVQAHDLCLLDPGPEIFVGELGESSVNIFCRPWVKSDDYWTVFWDLTGQAKEQFDATGISIPFPQRDVHLIPVPQE
ncbi:mechanosensitive ion channel family protein [Parasedimentitalea psychrophila]|uniref:Small-conductance mechanosensitive channel n=1 Tax=Parasedimentitalea psychrophila TaxID=2997337 RepID=A0A9Y2P059_9RHOB|nr:mechanosensitive ion channel family protein [Parasedimentitalea psychrophila]WIY24271.1 mechanosensitive ion channel family protein [Parasedimentitalea psychrophila]